MVARFFAFALVSTAALAQGFPEHYGADAGGTRYAPLAQITPANVGDLVQAWAWHSGDLAKRTERVMRLSKFQVTPILADDKLVVCTPFNEVAALDPASGAERWRFDPKIATDYRPANFFNCRGVALWRDPKAKKGETCATRIFAATNDARLFALDLATGKPCAGFGAQGEVKIDPGKPLLDRGEFAITSAPLAAGSVVIVGSAINDNQRVGSPRGTVRAFDARSGAPRWQWDPIPVSEDDPASKTWGNESWKSSGSANVWAPMSVDLQRGLVFLPTSSPSPDFYGGLRPGADRRANSVVALKFETGALAWDFQTVHHDVWDYDVPAQPTLATIQVGGKPKDVVIAGNKQSMIFVLDRDTGAPVFPVEERPVPQNGAPGEALSPTQPFPADLPLLAPSKIAPGDAWGVTPWDRGKCRERIAAARNEGLYTPPSERGTILFPFTGGGINWGGVAIDRESDILYVNTTRLVHVVTLIPREAFAENAQEISAHRDHADGGHALRPDAPAARLSAPAALQPAALGRAHRARPAREENPLGNEPRHAVGHRSARHRAALGHADLRRPARHARRARLHRRDARQVPARVRREDGRGALGRAAARLRRRHADDLRVAGPAIRRHRRGRALGRRGRRRRCDRRLRAASSRRAGPQPLVARDRPAGRPLRGRRGAGRSAACPRGVGVPAPQGARAKISIGVTRPSFMPAVMFAIAAGARSPWIRSTARCGGFSPRSTIARTRAP